MVGGSIFIMTVHPSVVSCLARVRLPVRNGLVNKVELLGLIPKSGNEIARSVTLCSTSLTTVKYTRVCVPFLTGC